MTWESRHRYAVAMTAAADVEWTIYSDVIKFLADGFGDILKLLTDTVNNLDLDDLEPVIEGAGLTWDTISESILSYCESLPDLNIIFV